MKKVNMKLNIVPENLPYKRCLSRINSDITAVILQYELYYKSENWGNSNHHISIVVYIDHVTETYSIYPITTQLAHLQVVAPAKRIPVAMVTMLKTSPSMVNLLRSFENVWLADLDEYSLWLTKKVQRNGLLMRWRKMCKRSKRCKPELTVISNEHLDYFRSLNLLEPKKNGKII